MQGKHLKTTIGNRLSRFVFWILYLVVVFFIRIGEATKILVFLPFQTAISIYFELKDLAYNLKKGISLVFKSSKHALSRFKISFQFPELHIHFPEIKKEYFKVNTTFLSNSTNRIVIYLKKQFILLRSKIFAFLKYIYTYIGVYLILLLPHESKQQHVSIPKPEFIKRIKPRNKDFSIYRQLFVQSRRKVTQLFISLVGNLKQILILFSKIKLMSLRTLHFFLRLIVSPLLLIRSIFSVRIRLFILGFFACLLMVFSFYVYTFIRDLPSPKDIGKVNYPLSTHIYDRNGKLLYEVYRDQNRTPVKLKDIPQYVVDATVAIEDKDFYKHSGVSIFSGVIRALKETVFEHNLQGGSTITQQLVKSALLTPERTIERKIKEIILAFETERLYTKKTILEMYLNQVPYGGPAYGIEEAAKTFFDKRAKDLTIPEAALLAGLPQAPSFYSPFVNPNLTLRRRNEVLAKMLEQGYLTKDEFKKAKSTPVHINPPKVAIKAPHFVFYTKSLLEQQYGAQQVEEGGLKVTTTLDLDIQEKTEQILKAELEKIKYLNVTNGAVLITRPNTGEILAMVGSVDYFATPSGAFNVTTALRQPGSTIKPLMYSLALERGYTAASILDDTPTTFNADGAEPYQPVNYDGKFHGKVPLRYALANSFNIPAVKVLNTIGVQQFVEHARKMGISTWDDSSRFGLSLTLGGGEVTMIDMSQAFGVFANKGERVPLEQIIRLDDMYGKKIYELVPNRTKVLDEGIAYIISDILSDNFARQMEFGPSSYLEIPGLKASVKTGTTNDKKDNWTIGYTPEFLVTVWVGNNNNTPMHPYLTSGITGAAPIWNQVMSYLIKNYGDTKKWFDKPSDVTERICYYGKKEYFLQGTETSSPCRDSIAGPTTTALKDQ